MDILVILGIMLSPIGAVIIAATDWYIKKRQIEQAKIENEKEKRDNQSPFGLSVVGLIGDHSKSKWDLFDSYLTNLELIPYHSEGITLPSKLSSSQLDYMKIRLKAAGEEEHRQIRRPTTTFL